MRNVLNKQEVGEQAARIELYVSEMAVAKVSHGEHEHARKQHDEYAQGEEPKRATQQEACRQRMGRVAMALPLKGKHQYRGGMNEKDEHSPMTQRIEVHRPQSNLIELKEKQEMEDEDKKNR